MVKEFLSRKNVPYVERNVWHDLDARRDFKAMGYRNVPLIIVDGVHVRGPNFRELERLLAA